ncbi:MAG: 5'/3'-nucleotidase SurE, partial [Peptococcaceae bacterium]|nr:5'/3'-nucleotidase SurE [Peptococcaceae bacterium]
VSGINQGQNIGTDVLYSGTVSAAIEASLQGVPAIAVSLTSYESQDFDTAAKFVRKLCEFIDEHDMIEDTLLNVNVPPVPADQIKGVRITRLSHVKYKNVFKEIVAETGERYFVQGGEILDDGTDDDDTDFKANANNEITITPIHFDLTNYKIIDLVKSWQIEK